LGVLVTIGPTYVLIATAGRPDLLSRTLESLSQSDRPANLAGVVVIENGTPSGAKAVCEKAYGDYQIDYRWTAVANKSRALNVAMEEIPGDALIIFGDDDIRYERRTLAAYEAAGSLAPEGTFFGGPFGCDYESEPPPWLRRYLPLSAVGWNPAESEVNPATTRFIGFNWAARCGDIKRLGGFDPNFGPGSPTKASGQESNMQRRMREAGMRARLVRDAVVHHFVPQSRCSPEWVLQRSWRNGVSRGLVYRDRSLVEIGWCHWGNLVRLTTSSLTWCLSRPFPASRLHFHSRYRCQKAIGYFEGFRTGTAAVTCDAESRRTDESRKAQSRRAA
jgi:GT2 family glycosyltransferase